MQGSGNAVEQIKKELLSNDQMNHTDLVRQQIRYLS